MKNLRKLLIVTSLFGLTFCSGEVDSSPIDDKDSKTAEQEPIINVITPETTDGNGSEARENLEENDQDPVNNDYEIDTESNTETSTSKEPDKFDPYTYCDSVEEQSWDAVSIFSTLKYHFLLHLPEGSKYIIDRLYDIKDVNDAVLNNLKGYQGFEKITGRSPSLSGVNCLVFENSITTLIGYKDGEEYYSEIVGNVEFKLYENGVFTYRDWTKSKTYKYTIEEELAKKIFDDVYVEFEKSYEVMQENMAKVGFDFFTSYYSTFPTYEIYKRNVSEIKNDNGDIINDFKTLKATELEGSVGDALFRRTKSTDIYIGNNWRDQNDFEDIHVISLAVYMNIEHNALYIITGLEDVYWRIYNIEKFYSISSTEGKAIYDKMSALFN